MEKELNITTILKDKSKGIKLYSVTFGDCTFDGVTGNNNISLLYLQDSPFFTDEYGKYNEKGECLIFPSRNMRVWSKFAWKKGDVLATDINTLCIFEGWVNDEYTQFKAKYNTRRSDWHFYSDEVKPTCDWAKLTDDDVISQYISKIEEHYSGKLNLDTLGIEKHQFKDGDILYIEVGLYRSKYILIYCKDNEVFIPTYYCFLNLASRRHDDIFKVRNSPLPFSIICDEEDIMVVRLATDSEKQQLFSALEKEGKAWDVERKAIVDLPKKCEFKAFDKVLAKFDEDLEWMPDFFYYYDNTDNEMPYVCVANGRAIACIPYND